MTLFANILQNPQDPRARADVKLMNLVVNFLTLLASDEENGSVKRMLGVCSEFERIAKVVLDKADRETNSKRKRKVVPEEEMRNVQNLQALVTGTPPKSARTQAQQPNMTSPNAFTPSVNSLSSSQAFNTPNGAVYTPPPEFNSNMPFTPGFESDFANILASQNGIDHTMGDRQQMPNTTASPLNFGTFQQPFVPQDLWQMPMTLEWDWADMTNTGYPSYEHPDGPYAGMPT